MKIVLNKSFSEPFELSDKAKNVLKERGMSADMIDEMWHPIHRTNEMLVAVVEELGPNASSARPSRLEVVEFDNTNYDPVIKPDGWNEDLVFVPVLRLSAVVGKTPEEIMNHANSIGIRTSR